MKKNLTVIIDNLITFLLVLIVFSLPLIFLPLTTEYFETPKFIFLSISILVLIILWGISWILQGKVLLTRTPLDTPLVILGLIVGLSTFFSDSRLIAFYGNFPKVHGSAISWISYLLLYFITSSHIRQKKQIRFLLYALLLSGSIVAISSILSYFNVYLLGSIFKFSQIANFTLTGSSFSTTALLALLLPFCIISLILHKQLIPLPLALLLSTLFSVTIALTGNFATYILGMGAFIGVIYLNWENLKHSLLLILIPLILSVIIFGLGFTPLNNNPLYSKNINFPREIELPFTTSWKISISAFRDHPFLGSGPSTYLFDFTAYKPTEYNQNRFWNVRFDTSYNEFLQVLATLGVLGTLAFVFFIVIVLTFAWKSLRDENPLISSLSLTSILAIALFTLHTTTLVILVLTLVLLAILMAVHKSTGKIEELTLGISAKIHDNNYLSSNTLPIIIFAIIIIFVSFSGWNLSKIILADYYHRLALNAASTKPLDTYQYLRLAEQANPYVDLYRTDLAQTNFALANAIASQRGPSTTSPSGSLTDQDKQNINQLISQAILEAKAATVISPQSAQNWEILGLIYRQISGVAQNALSFALDSYGRAIQKDPYNPMLRISVGGSYYATKNYDLAIRFFTDAVNLKPDYAHAYYNLAVALKDKGELKDAQVAAEKTIFLLDKDSPDYQTASHLLDDIKNQLSKSEPNNTPQTSQIVPPAAKETGALQNKKLPNVINLPKPQEITTPSAIPTNR